MNAPSTLRVRVARKTVEALHICSFELTSADGKPLPAFSAGSHVDVQVPGSSTRQYSLCNDPAESHRYLIGVLKDPGTRGGSKAMHEKVKEGDTLEISAPKNHFALAHEAKHHVLLAGGIGVTPILCMAERLAVTGTSFEMHYCTRSKERTAFVERIAKSGYAARVAHHYDDGAPINIGVGEDVTIKQLAETVARVVGFEGRLTWDTSKPDGTPRKLLDVSRINGLGWKASIGLEDGIRSTYQWFLLHEAPNHR